MKRVLILFLASVLVLLTGCYKVPDNQNGVWITYYELEKMFEGDVQQEIRNVIDNCKEMKIGNLYVHTRAFGSTIYKSEYFSMLESVKKYNFDVFSFIIKECKSVGLKVHAWINPYRLLSGSTDINNLDPKSPAYRWINDEILENNDNVCFSNGIYLNPASSEVRTLIVDSLREIIMKYDVDGIHFDDYFYPTTETDFDKSSFQNYKINTANPKHLSDWRRENVSELIRECKNIINNSDKDVVFSISPNASIKQNYENLYADISKWIENGYVDEIIPQLYFGFEYPDESFRFLNLLDEWKTLSSKNKAVKLKIGLGFYKSIPYLEADKTEWNQNFDIISRQAEICDDDISVSGYVLFSYSTLFSNKEAYLKQRENLKNRT